MRCDKFWQEFYFSYEEADKNNSLFLYLGSAYKLSIKHNFIDKTHKLEQLFQINPAIGLPSDVFCWLRK